MLLADEKPFETAPGNDVFVSRAVAPVGGANRWDHSIGLVTTVAAIISFGSKCCVSQSFSNIIRRVRGIGAHLRGRFGRRTRQFLA